MTSHSGFAQTIYPLAAPAKATDETTTDIHFSDLPALPDSSGVVEQQSYQEPIPPTDPTALSQSSLTASFESAYRPLNSLSINPLPIYHDDETGDLQLNPIVGNSNPVPHLASRHYGRVGSTAESTDTVVNGILTNSGIVRAAEPAGFGEFSGWSSEGENQVAVDDVNSTTWWKSRVLLPILSPGSEQSVSTNSLVFQTLQQSPRIRALSQNPLIREQQVIEADSTFDPVSFVRSEFQDRTDPVGDNLSVTSDGSDFLENHIWSGDFGVRKKMRTGATYEVGQTLGFKNSNSSFFTPQDQGTATLALNVTQPLMRGRGRYYNQSQILIAQSAGGAAWDTFVAELQQEIVKTVKAYWQLYYDRSVYLQKKRNVERGEKILQTLEGRRDLDSLPSQITRARSAVQSRRTDLANALRDILDSETELRRLTADSNWQANQGIEMLPTESPSTDGLEIGLENVVLTAIEHRPEIRETMARAKIAGIQRDISENELMPELSLLLGTYVSALSGESQLGQAIQDQFGAVKPGYSVGVEFEMPFRNRAAQSRLAQRKLQLAKIRAEVDEAMQNVIAESQVSLRRVTSAKQTLDAALQAIEAANADLEQNFRRWESFALIEGDIAEGQTPTTALDQLLDSQERLTAAELVYTQSELELKTAEVSLQRTMGTLLIHKNVTFAKNYDGSVPELRFNE